MPDTDDPLLVRHLATWVGAWPPPAHGIEVVASEHRSRPGWDGRRSPMFGVLTPAAGVLSVPPGRVEAVREAVGGLGVDRVAGAAPAIAEAVGVPGARMIDGVFRWSTTPTPLPDAGRWVPVDDPVVPPWLVPFGGEVLVALEDGRYVAGVGVKRHDPTGQEIAVGTEPQARGRGLARALVCQAARRILAGGAVVTYLHAPDNVASAHVAEASGFPDLGWRVLGLSAP